MKKSLEDIVSAVTIFFITSAYLVGTLFIKRSKVDNFSGETFPRILGSIMLVLSLALLISASRAHFRKKGTVDKEKTALSTWFEKNAKIFQTFFLIIVYIFSWDYIGFLLATILYLFIQFLIFNSKPIDLKRIASFGAIAVACSTVVYVVFVNIFSVPLSSGIF